MKQISKLLKYNWAYLLWFGVYLFIGTIVIHLFVESAGLSFLYAIIIYGVSIAIALSPIGEMILRAIEGATPVLTQEEKEYLLPLFYEVYEQAKEKTPEISPEINLYIAESMTVNAFAAGRKTIAVTRGAIEALDREQLKGILAHEFGHMAHNDTKALLITLVGNGFFSLIIFVLKFFMDLLQTIFVAIQGKNIILVFLSVLTWLSRLLIDIATIVFVLFGNILLSFNSILNECRADSYAYTIGYGEQLISSLYLLRKISLPSKMTLLERLTATHPHIDIRIERLEQMAK